MMDDDRSPRIGEPYEQVIRESLERMARERIVQRIWAKDYRVWKPDRREITNRMGWLRTSEVMIQEGLPRLRDLLGRVDERGFTHAVVLGMGGSSRAAATFSSVFGKKEGFLELSVLESTDPAAVRAAVAHLSPDRTLFIVASKSGTTFETISFLKHFYSWVSESTGPSRAGGSFVAITDPGTALASLAVRKGFMASFLNDKNIGGRYSALSYFGLVPAALIGVDVSALLERAIRAATRCEAPGDLGRNPGVRLGAMMGELARRGRDKATLVTSRRLEGFGGWAEQMIAESTGKEGKGILPVVGEPLEQPRAYGRDRLFFSIRLQGDPTERGQDAFLRRMEDAGHPVAYLGVHELNDLGALFFIWELATAVAGHILGVNPFDQPNVELTKVLTTRGISEFKRNKRLPWPEPALESPNDGMVVYAEAEGSRPGQMLVDFLSQGGKGSYIAVQAYVQPTPETDRALHELRGWLLTRFGLATSVGYGPGFLHSTGELFKGDRGNGLFVQVVSESRPDVPIPDELGLSDSSVTFGMLKEAQALGDREAMIEGRRRVITLRLAAGVGVAQTVDRLLRELRRLEVQAS